MRICIYGSASDKIAEKYKKAVYDLAFALAERGHSLVFGGGGHGIMGAAARGFTDGHGRIFGVVPTFFKTTKVEHLYERCDEVCWTDDMHERKRIMEDAAEAFIIAPGGAGTYDELFSALTNKQLDQMTKPIAVFGPYGFYDELFVFLEKAIKENFINDSCRELVKIFTEIGPLIEYLESDKPFEYLKGKGELKNG